MATARPFAYNTGSPIAGTIQVGSLAVGTPTSGFTGSPKWWNGPDEELGYVIAIPVSANTQPTPISGVTASVGFDRTTGFSDSEFISYATKLTGVQFTDGIWASQYLTNNGYWNSYTGGTTGLTVNSYYGGGIIGYIFRAGEPRFVSGETHGIIVNTNNYGTFKQDGSGDGYIWGCSGTTSGLGEVVGSGLTNQQIILSYLNTNCPSSLSDSGFNFATGQTTNGYNDWFIPNGIEFRSVVSGTAALNLVKFSGYSDDNLTQAYLSSQQNTSTTYRVAQTQLDRPPTYIPAGTFNIFKDGSFNIYTNLKLFRYF